MPLSLKEIEKVKFQELLPLQLKNDMTRKNEKGADTTCLQEMAVMFACMKKADFKEAKCSEEISIFNKCYWQHMETKKMQKERESSGEIVTGKNVRNLTLKQLNQILQKYPQYNEKL